MNQISASLGGVLAEAPVAMEHNGRFTVWRKGTPFPPQKFHLTHRAASAEAARLSRKVPGARFHVVQFCDKLWLKGAPRIDAVHSAQSGRSYTRPLFYLFGLVLTVTLGMILLSEFSWWVHGIAHLMVRP